ncbi:DDB1- and CUL4-associated factor 8 isoform X1, partial [Tanacetum coccineum]
DIADFISICKIETRKINNCSRALLDSNRARNLREKGGEGCSGTAFFDTFDREVGTLPTRSFYSRRSASEDLILGRGTLQTWDWESGVRKWFLHETEIASNHRQAKFIDETVIVARGDTGRVNRYELLQDGRVNRDYLGGGISSRLPSPLQRGTLNNQLAIDPGSRQVFYTCDEMGRVMQFDLRDGYMEGQHLRSFNHIASNHRQAKFIDETVFDPMRHFQFAVAGSDQFARLYDVRKLSSNDIIASFCPSHLAKTPRKTITSLAFSRKSEILVSHYEELSYLFSTNDVNASDCLKKYTHNHPMSMNCMSFFGPNHEYVLGGSDSVCLFIWRKADSKLLHAIVEDERGSFCNIEANQRSGVFASCGTGAVKIWSPGVKKKAKSIPQIPEDELGNLIFGL